MDQFFDTLLLDGRILYSKFHEDKQVLDLIYGDTLYELSLRGFIDLYPRRKKYTLQTAGLYYLGCVLGQLTPSFLREDILNNYGEFKLRNGVSKTDFVSLILICVPAFLLTVIKGDTGSNIQEVLKKTSVLKPEKKNYKARRQMVDDSAPGGFYVVVIALGVMTTLATSGLFIYVLRTYPRGLPENKNAENASETS